MIAQCVLIVTNKDGFLHEALEFSLKIPFELSHKE